MYVIHTYPYNTLLWLENTSTGKRMPFESWNALRRHLGQMFNTIKCSDVINHSGK